MRYLAAILLLISILLGSCSVTDPQTSDEHQIRDLIYEITRAFNWSDIDGIMQYVHPDFHHKGMYKWHLKSLWQDRLASFSLMETTIDRIDIQGDYATVHFQLTFTSATESVSSAEPEKNGDMSFLYYDGTAWRVFGDQGFF